MAPIAGIIRSGLFGTIATATLLLACSESEFTSSKPVSNSSERNDKDLNRNGQDNAQDDGSYDGHNNGSGSIDLGDGADGSRTVGDAATNSDLKGLTIENGEQVLDLCERLNPEVLTQEIEFRYQGLICPWNAADNLSKQNNLLNARTEQSVQLNLPDDAIICDFDLDFPVQQAEYDDHIYLLMNDYILAASKLPAGHFVQEGNLMKYDWLKLRGMFFDNKNDVPVCLGKDEGGTCIIPETQTTGRFEIDVPQDRIAELAVELRQSEETHFRFVAGGDNDEDDDCQWDPIRFTAKVEYIAP